MRQHTDLRDLRTNHRAEAALDYALVIGIGVLLAASLVLWWTS